jgi:class 3 adenylate cyclase
MNCPPADGAVLRLGRLDATVATARRRGVARRDFALQRAATEAVEKFGGHVAKNLGDELLIYVGGRRDSRWASARALPMARPRRAR